MLDVDHHERLKAQGSICSSTYAGQHLRENKCRMHVEEHMRIINGIKNAEEYKEGINAVQYVRENMCGSKISERIISGITFAGQHSRKNKCRIHVEDHV